jgi:hypothetical protein
MYLADVKPSSSCGGRCNLLIRKSPLGSFCRIPSWRQPTHSKDALGLFRTCFNLHGIVYFLSTQSQHKRPTATGSIQFRWTACGRRLAAVYGGMAFRTEGNQIRLGIIPSMAAELLMVDFQIRHCTAGLASPAIATKYQLPPSFVQKRLKPERDRLCLNRFHAALGPRLLRKASCRSAGRNRKNLVIENSSVPGFPLSRFAPARKSAQIISTQ